MLCIFLVLSPFCLGFRLWIIVTVQKFRFHLSWKRLKSSNYYIFDLKVWFFMSIQYTAKVFALGLHTWTEISVILSWTCREPNPPELNCDRTKTTKLLNQSTYNLSFSTMSQPAAMFVYVYKAYMYIVYVYNGGMPISRAFFASPAVLAGKETSADWHIQSEAPWHGMG